MQSCRAQHKDRDCDNGCACCKNACTTKRTHTFGCDICQSVTMCAGESNRGRHSHRKWDGRCGCRGRAWQCVHCQAQAHCLWKAQVREPAKQHELTRLASTMMHGACCMTCTLCVILLTSKLLSCSVSALALASQFWQAQVRLLLHFTGMRC